MTTSIETHPPLRRFSFSILILTLSLGLSLTGCKRSLWIKPDGREVLPREQLACAEYVHQSPKEDIVEQEILEQRIEQCMLDKGYQHRPWWSFKDFHWDLKEPTQ